MVVLLNSDMRVEPVFLQPLLDGSRMNGIFGFLPNLLFRPDKIQEETGLTEFWWERGSLAGSPSHRGCDKAVSLRLWRRRLLRL